MVTYGITSSRSPRSPRSSRTRWSRRSDVLPMLLSFCIGFLCYGFWYSYTIINNEESKTLSLTMAMMEQDFVGSNQLRNDERKGLSPEVRLLVKAYANIPDELRPFPPQTPGIFLHIGKAGGSFLCQRLRWSCHHFMVEKMRHQVSLFSKKSSGTVCKKIANETYFSHVSTYMHIPDFYLFKRGIYKVGQFLFYTACNVRFHPVNNWNGLSLYFARHFRHQSNPFQGLLFWIV